jgi:hypothetical protein
MILAGLVRGDMGHSQRKPDDRDSGVHHDHHTSAAGWVAAIAMRSPATIGALYERLNGASGDVAGDYR